MPSKKKHDYDLIIVGAGLVGTSVVVALQKAGLRIAVLEKHLPAVITPNKDDQRPLTLAYGSQRCLDQWGIWPSLATTAMPIQTLHVSEQGRLGRVRFSAEEEAVPALGYVVPFAQLQSALYQSAASQAETIFISIEDIHSLVCNEEGATIEYTAANEQLKMTATLLIAADGAHSSCRELLQIQAQEKKPGDLAFIATLQCAQAHQAIAYQRFTPQGSLALLPLLDRSQYRLVWSMKKSSQHEIVESWSDEQLLAMIDESYGGRLGGLVSIRRDAVFPLEVIIAEEMIRASVVLLGNAAHTIYPIAAQGFNLSLQDAAVLARVLQRALQHGESIGSLSILQRYLDRRQDNQQAVIKWSHRISDVFRWNIPCLDHARGMALLGLDVLPFLKHKFSRYFLHA